MLFFFFQFHILTFYSVNKYNLFNSNIVKSKRSQLVEDQTEADRASDNTDNGKIIKSKKRKIKQANRNQSTKKIKSLVMSNDSTNLDDNQQLLNNNDDNSVSHFNQYIFDPLFNGINE